MFPLRPVIVVTLAFFAFQSAVAQVAFRKLVTLPYAGYGIDTHLVDIDGDGDNDVVFLTNERFGLYVLYNDNASFSRLETILADRYAPTSIQLYDTDGDNVKDIVALNPYTKEIAIYKFDTDKIKKVRTVVYEEFTTADRVLCTDINKDGEPDFILTYQLVKFVVLLLSTGDGYFVESKITTPEIVGHHIELGDVDADGNADLVINNDGKQVCIYKGNGEGDFQFSSFFTAGFLIMDFAIADFINDEKLELILFTIDQQSPSNNGTVEFFELNEPGVYQKTWSKSEYRTSRIIVDYMDDDDDLDYAVINSDYPDIFLHLNNGHTPVDGPDGWGLDMIQPIESKYTGLVFGDVDGDAYPEVVPLCTAGHIEILKKTTYEYVTYSNFQYSATGWQAGTLGDLNNDGMPDLVLPLKDARAISIQYNTGDTRIFGDPVFFNTELPPVKALVGDFNGDSYKDILYLTARREHVFPSDNITAVLFGSDDGTFTQKVIDAAIPYSLDLYNINTLNFNKGDFNSDGRDDLQFDSHFYYGNADGTFTEVTANVSTAGGQVAADFNNDGFDDVAISGNNGIHVVWGRSEMQPLEPDDFEAPAATIMFVANVNNDDYPDLICPATLENWFLILIGNGDGTFVQKIVNVVNTPFRCFVTDLDVDGDDDIAFTNYFTTSIDIYLNDGAGTFSESKSISQPSANSNVIMLPGFVNKDDRPDIVFVPENKGAMILLGYRYGKPTKAPTFVDVTDVTASTAQFTFDVGDGVARMLVLKEGSEIDEDPADHKSYTASNVMGQGTEIGSGNFVVFLDDASSAPVANLKEKTTYFYELIEVGEEKGGLNTYLTTQTISGSFETKFTQSLILYLPDKTIGDPDFDIEASSNRDLPISLELLSGGVTLTGNTVKILQIGPVAIRATAEGNDEVEPATLVGTFCIDPVEPELQITEIDPYHYTLQSSASSHNQWYWNGLRIEGATEPVFQPVKNGKYTVRVEYLPCYSESQASPYLFVGIDEPSSNISISPNPVARKLFVTTIGNLSTAPEVIDVTGRSYSADVTRRQNGFELDVAHLSPGLYFLRVNPQTIFKFVKE